MFSYYIIIEVFKYVFSKNKLFWTIFKQNWKSYIINSKSISYWYPGNCYLKYNDEN